MKALSESVIAIDIGGTNTRVALFSSAMTSNYQLICTFNTDLNYASQLERLITTIKNTGKNDFVGIGISLCGRIDPDGQTIRASLNLPNYGGKSLTKDFETAFKCQTAIAHDATCGLLGEYGHGSLKNYNRSGYMTISTGIGSAIRLGNNIDSITMSTEAGHQIMEGNDLRCTCGQVGCIETLIGGREIQQRLSISASEITDSDFWKDYSTNLAIALSNFALSTGIDAICLGGAIILKQKILWTLLTQEFANRLTYQPVTLLRATLKEEAPLIGAATLLSAPADKIFH